MAGHGGKWRDMAGSGGTCGKWRDMAGHGGTWRDTAELQQTRESRALQGFQGVTGIAETNCFTWNSAPRENSGTPSARRLCNPENLVSNPSRICLPYNMESAYVSQTLYGNPAKKRHSHESSQKRWETCISAVPGCQKSATRVMVYRKPWESLGKAAFWHLGLSLDPL